MHSRPVIDGVDVWMGLLLSMSSHPPPKLVLYVVVFLVFFGKCLGLNRDGAPAISIIIVIIIITSQPQYNHSIRHAAIHIASKEIYTEA